MSTRSPSNCQHGESPVESRNSAHTQLSALQLVSSHATTHNQRGFDKRGSASNHSTQQQVKQCASDMQDSTAGAELQCLVPELQQCVHDIVNESQGELSLADFDQSVTHMLVAQPFERTHAALNSLLAMAPCLVGSELLAEVSQLLSNG